MSVINPTELKKAMSLIKKILDAYDIAATVALHSPGLAEYLVKIDPSYSCAKFQDKQLRVRAVASELKGGMEERDKKLEDTANMLHLLTNATAHIYSMLQGATEKLDVATQAIHYNPDTPDNAKN